MEIERKFLLPALPDFFAADPARFSSIPMEQGYLCTEPVVRVRREGNDYVLTYKGAGALSREEVNLPLTEAAFQRLLKKCDGRIIQKTRYRISLELWCPGSGEKSLVAELDIFSGDLSGLIYVEVEFPTEEAALSFVPPAWFGREVTGLPGYSNSALSEGADPRIFAERSVCEK